MTCRGIWLGLVVAIYCSLTPCLFAQQPMNKQFQSMVVDPFDGNAMWGVTRVRNLAVTDANAPGAFTSTLYRTSDGGLLWRAVRTPWNHHDTVKLHFDARNPLTLYAILNRNPQFLWRSDNGGETWAAVVTGLPNAALVSPSSLHSDPNQNVLYLQYGQALYKSTNRGDTWAKHADIPCSFAIEINRNDAQQMFCAVNLGDQVARSTNEGKNWQTGGKLAHPSGAFTSMVSAVVHSDPKSPNTLLIGLFGTRASGAQALQADAVFRSTNGGMTATAIAGMPGLHRMHAAPDRSVVIVTGSGSFSRRTRDMGATWTSGPALTNTTQNDQIAYNPANPEIGWFGPTSRTVNAGASTETVAGQVNVIVVATETSPIRQTLRKGTAFLRPHRFLDTDRAVASGIRMIPAPAAPWLHPGYFNDVLLSAAAVEPGNYRATARFGNADHTAELAFELEVTPATDSILPLEVETIAGNGLAVPSNVQTIPGPLSFEGQQAAASPFVCCGKTAIDADGNMYVLSRTRIMKITPDGVIRGFAGTGAEAPANSRDADKGKPALQSRFRQIAAALATPQGLVFADNLDHQIWRVGADGILQNLYNRSSFQMQSLGFSPMGLAADPAGNIHFTALNGIYRVVSPSQASLVVHASDFPQAQGSPTAVAFQPNGNMVVAFDNAIYRRTPQGAFSVIGGTPRVYGFRGDGGQVAGSLVSLVADLALDSKGNVFIADGQRVRVLSSDGRIDTVAGDGEYGPALATGSRATSGGMSPVNGVAVGKNDELVVSTGAYLYRLKPAGAKPSPQPNTGGVVSLAAGSPTVAAGAIFSIYGVNLSGMTGAAQRVPLPLILAGVEVRVNGRTVPLYFVSPLQINAQMPGDIAPGTVNVEVVRDGVPSGAVTVTVAPTAPDLLVYSGTRAVALDEAYALVGESNPAKPGKFILLYLSGVGSVSPAVPVGSAASATELSHATLPFSATIGGQPAEVAFLGLAPGFVGLGQANILVPPGLAAGDHPLVLTVGGVASNTATLRVVP